MENVRIEYWKVVEISGGGDMHSDGLTFDEAKTSANELNELFPDECYIVEPDPSYEERKEREMTYQTRYNIHAVDGWEDIYPDRD